MPYSLNRSGYRLCQEGDIEFPDFANCSAPMSVQKAAEYPRKCLFGIQDFTHGQDALKFGQYTDTDVPGVDGELSKGQDHGVSALFNIYGHSGSIVGFWRPVPK
jgi:hypothetical protein